MSDVSNFLCPPVDDPTEAARLGALHSYGILDTLPEPAYDDITRLAASICGTPIALVTLIDLNRQWYKSSLGVGEVRETLRELAFCAHAIQQPNELLVVPDATQDARFANNPIVTGEMQVRFYAGAPLVTPGGQALGTLCVMDRKPHQLTEEQSQALAALARQVIAQLELRRQTVEQEELLRQLSASEARFEAFMRHGPLVTYIKDAYGRLIYVNPAWEERFGKTAAEFIGKSDAELWPPELARSIRAHDEEVLAGDKMARQLESVPISGGDWKHWMVYKFPLVLPDGRYLAGAALDVTEQQCIQDDLRVANSRLNDLSLTDTLTDLLNRRGFEQRLNEEAHRAARHGRPLSLLLMHVDDFQQFNSTYGHEAGDEMLNAVAHLLRLKMRDSDLLAHYGSEEFVALLPETDHKGAVVLAERFRSAVSAASWKQRRVTVSIGVATADIVRLSDAAFDGDTLLAEADIRLYQSKQRGHSQITHA